MIRSQACAKECEKRSGEWSVLTNTCEIRVFLSRLCLRVTYHNDTMSWHLDTPSYPRMMGVIRRDWSAMPPESGCGCEMESKNNYLVYSNTSRWLPFIYSNNASGIITAQVFLSSCVHV